MSIESFLAARLLADPTIAAHLTMYTPPPGTTAYPAIFQGIAPTDTDPGWPTDSAGAPVEFPRLTFQVFRTLSNEQTLRGTVHVQIWTRETDTSQLRALQNAILACLNNAPLATDEGLIELVFATATPFRQEQNTAIVGTDLGFNFDAYVSQTSFPPDPIAALNGFAAHNLDTAIKVMPTSAVASDSAPLLYWRLVGDNVVPRDQLNWGTWHTITARGHVLCPGAYARLTWAQLIAQALTATPYRRLRLNDGSPLLIQRVRTDFTANPTSQGQITVEARYGVLSSAVVTDLTNPPIDPAGQGGGSGGSTGGGSPPPPPIVPPTVDPPVYTPQRPVVNPGDTGQLLKRLSVVIRAPDETGSAPETLTVQDTAPTITVSHP